MPKVINKEVFQCVFINDKKELWIEQAIYPDINFSIQYQIFEAALSTTSGATSLGV